MNVLFPDVPVIVRRRMARIRGKATRPELLVRQTVRALGIGYRLNRRDLPGSPDLVFMGRKKVIFVHGCFWHQHGCKLTGKATRSAPSTGPQAQAERKEGSGGATAPRRTRLPCPHDLGMRGQQPKSARTDSEIPQDLNSSCILMNFGASWCGEG